MAELQVAPDGRYLGGPVPFGYAVWGDYLVEVPAELDACITMISLTRQGLDYDAIAAAVAARHGVTPSREQLDGLLASVRRRYGRL